MNHAPEGVLTEYMIGLDISIAKLSFKKIN